MAITREQANAILHEWTKTTSLLKHARSVEIVMKHVAKHYGEDEEKWALTGLLHDADYEKWPQEHPGHIVKWLREQEEEEMAHAISAHYTKWGVPYNSVLDKALLACDELTGFIIAYCYVRPKGIDGLTPKSIKKKLKQKEFAAKVDREEVYAGIEMLGVSIDDHIRLIIEALAPHADELGITGK